MLQRNGVGKTEVVFVVLCMWCGLFTYDSHHLIVKSLSERICKCGPAVRHHAGRKTDNCAAYWSPGEAAGLWRPVSFPVEGETDKQDPDAVWWSWAQSCNSAFGVSLLFSSSPRSPPCFQWRPLLVAVWGKLDFFLSNWLLGKSVFTCLTMWQGWVLIGFGGCWSNRFGHFSRAM